MSAVAASQFMTAAERPAECRLPQRYYTDGSGMVSLLNMAHHLRIITRHHSILGSRTRPSPLTSRTVGHGPLRPDPLGTHIFHTAGRGPLLTSPTERDSRIRPAQMTQIAGHGQPRSTLTAPMHYTGNLGAALN